MLPRPLERAIQSPGLRNGVRDTLAVVPPNVVMGLLFGATAVEVGFAPEAATAMSLLTFAARAQLAAVDLLAADAGLPVVLTTIVLINFRYAFFSAALVPQVRDLRPGWRALIAYFLFDFTYAFCVARYRDGAEAADHETASDAGATDGPDAGAATGPDAGAAPGGEGGAATEEPGVATRTAGRRDHPDDHEGWYFAGMALVLGSTFVPGTLLGGLVGQVVGRGADLGFMVPLIFIALLVPVVDDRRTAMASGVAAVVAVAAAGVPFNLGLLLAAFVGTAAGMVAERRGGQR